MIKQAQNIWIFIATLCVLCLYLFPLASVRINDAGGVIEITAGSVKELVEGKTLSSTHLWWVHGAILFTSVYLLILIFLYRNPKLQKSLVYIGVLSIAFLTFILSQTIKNTFNGIDLDFNHYKMAILLPSFAALSLVLAIKRLKKNESASL